MQPGRDGRQQPQRCSSRASRNLYCRAARQVISPVHPASTVRHRWGQARFQSQQLHVACSSLQRTNRGKTKGQSLKPTFAALSSIDRYADKAAIKLTNDYMIFADRALFHPQFAYLRFDCPKSCRVVAEVRARALERFASIFPLSKRGIGAYQHDPAVRISRVFF